jgi:hypothetical protein
MSITTVSPEKLALVRIGYAEYAVPLEALTAIAGLTARKVESEYRKGGYVYWYAPPTDDDMAVTVISAGRILESKPDAQPATPAPVVAVTPPDTRVFAAPSDGDQISIKSVPPMREFVDEWRHEEAA